jgi:hypothetical protein
MSHLTELERWPGHDELIFPCDCSDGDYLRLTWDDDDPEWRFLWVETWSHSPGFWKRLRGAWRIVTGRRWQHSEVVLSSEVVAALSEFLESRGAPVRGVADVQAGTR